MGSSLRAPKQSDQEKKNKHVGCYLRYLSVQPREIALPAEIGPTVGPAGASTREIEQSEV